MLIESQDENIMMTNHSILLEHSSSTSKDVSFVGNLGYFGLICVEISK